MSEIINIHDWVWSWLDRMDEAINMNAIYYIKHLLKEDSESDIDWAVDTNHSTEVYYYNLKATAEIIIEKHESSLDREKLISELQQLNYYTASIWKRNQ